VGKERPRLAWDNFAMQPILDIADLAQRREAAEATAEGAALFYAFGNFCALAAKPDLTSVRAMNALKGRPLDQVGSVTTTPERVNRMFDWDRVRLPWSALVAVMADLHALGPIGFRGPAVDTIPEHLTVTDDGVRTVQVISPGDACPSNALVGDVLDLTGEELLAITSANGSSHLSNQPEAAHYSMRAIQREFGERPGVTLIGHRNERAVRRRYPKHLPCSTSIVAFHAGELVLERLGSLDAGVIEAVATRHGLPLTVAADERVLVRRYRRPLSSSSGFGAEIGSRAATAAFARRRGRLTLISWARK
jgi:hypothetical protein